MRRRSIALTAACVAAWALAWAATASATVQPVVVVYRDTVVDPDSLTSQLQTADAFTAKFRYKAAIKGFAASLSDLQRSAVAADPSVAYVGADVSFTASGLVPLVSGETVPPGIRRVGAASLTQAHASANAAAAVIDSGVDLANADLNRASGTNRVT